MQAVHDGRVTTLDELEWFVVLAETEHMTRAAERLSIAQPTLSRALGRLERQVGAPLFDRINRLQLNPSGTIMLEHARRSLAELAAAEDRIGTLRDPGRGTVRLAFLHSIAAGLTPEVLRAYRTHAPEVTFELTQPVGHEIVELVRVGRVDIGMTAPRPADDDLAWLSAGACPSASDSGLRNRYPASRTTSPPTPAPIPADRHPAVGPAFCDHCRRTPRQFRRFIAPVFGSGAGGVPSCRMPDRGR